MQCNVSHQIHYQVINKYSDSMEVQLTALYGNYDRPTTDQPTETFLIYNFGIQILVLSIRISTIELNTELKEDAAIYL